MASVDSTFAGVCLGLITLGLWVGLGFLACALLQVRRAALAVEALAYDLGESVARVRSATGKLCDFATGVRSGWLRTLEAAAGAAAALWPKRTDGRREVHHG